MNSDRAKRIFLYAVLGVVLLGVVVWLANYLSTGTIMITTDGKDDTITLQRTSEGEPFTKIGIGSLSATVKHGQYTATVKNGSKTTIQVVNFKQGHKTFRYSISLASLLAVEPVTYGQNAQDLEVTSDQLIYLNGFSNTLFGIDSQNNLEQVNSQRLSSVKWADSSFGVGQDLHGRLYTITGNSVSPLKVPFSYSNKAVSFDVSPNKKIYISYGADVYVGGQASGFKKIYTASSSKPTLAAGTNAVAVSDSKYGPNASNISKPLLATVSISGEESRKNVEAERMTWSPNGQYLAVVNQASPVIYDVALRQATSVPTNYVVGRFEWLNDTTLLYSSSYELWTYSAPTQKTQLLASVGPADSITGLYVSSDRSYAYITTLGSTYLNYAIKRIGLKNQPVPDYIHKLSGVLPENLPKYSVGLVNFSLPPTVLVQPLANIPPEDYTQQAQTQLQSQGIDTSLVRFRLEPTPSGD